MALGPSIAWRAATGREFCTVRWCRSSRSHAIYTVTVNRVVVELLDELDSNLKAKVSWSCCSPTHLCQTAVSGVTLHVCMSFTCLEGRSSSTAWNTFPTDAQVFFVVVDVAKIK